MKTIVVACGTGIVTSAIMNSAIDTLLKKNRVLANVIQCKFSQIDKYISSADFIVTSLRVQKDLGKPIIVGTGFVTGVGVEALEAEILKQLA